MESGRARGWRSGGIVVALVGVVGLWWAVLTLLVDARRGDLYGCFAGRLIPEGAELSENPLAGSRLTLLPLGRECVYRAESGGVIVVPGDMSSSFVVLFAVLALVVGSALLVSSGEASRRMNRTVGAIGLILVAVLPMPIGFALGLRAVPSAECLAICTLDDTPAWAGGTP